MITNLYIDDIRDPEQYLSPELVKDIVWIKDWWEAKVFLRDHAATLEVIHFDHYMGGGKVAGDLFSKVAYRAKKGEYPNLKQIYLHSSDVSVVDHLMEKKESLAELGIELIKNCNRH